MAETEVKAVPEDDGLEAVTEDVEVEAVTKEVGVESVPVGSEFEWSEVEYCLERLIENCRLVAVK